MSIFKLPDSSIFDLEKIYIVAFNGISKAYLFTGFTWNATHASLLEYKIKDLNPNIEILRQPLSQELHVGLQNEFGHWVVWHALSQMMESFLRFMDAIFELIINVKRMNAVIGRKKSTSLLNEFMHSLSFERKMEKLIKFGISIYHRAQIISLMEARNQFIHHYAMAKAPYQDIKWIAPWFAYKDQDGELHELAVGVVLDNAKEWVTIEKSFTKRFSSGQTITLEMIELHWMCFMMQTEIEGMLKALEARLEAAGCQRI